jgi:predicted outer membrane repeat protein
MANKAYYLLQYLLLVRQVAAVTVSSQVNLFAGVTDQASLEFSNTILLQQQFTLDNVVGVTVKGNSFSLEGSGNSRCIDIQDSSAVFSDLTITEGNATGGTSTTATNDRNGGGVRILGQSVVAFETCVIIDNVADKINEGNGGGVFISGLPSTARVSFTDCTISSNKASVRGGGIYVEAANVTIASSIFTLNIATLKYSSDDPGSGGAIAVKDQVGLHLSSTTFSYNEALGELTGGGSPRLGGGAIFFTSKSSNSVEYGWVVIANCLFKSNVARGNGGAISSSSIDFEIYSSSFVDNVAGSSGSGTGGAVYLGSGKIRGYAMESFSGNTEVGGVPNDVAGTNADEFECTSGCSAGFFGRGGSTAEGTSECFYGLKCVGCPGGKFLPTTDSILASDCQNCVQGRASEPGSAECSSCAVGTYATNQSDDTTGGQVAPVFEGAKFCLSCPAGTAGPSVSAVVCQSCAGNLWSSAGSSACARCKADYFYSLDDTCEACPAGTTCPSAGNSTQQHLSLSAGYWRSAVTTFPLSIKACPLTGSCLGGTDFDKGYCAKGFEGPLCAGKCFHSFTLSENYTHCLSYSGSSCYHYLCMLLFFAVCSARWYKFSNACYACDASWSGEFVAFLAITLLLVGIMFVFLLRRRRKQAGWSLSFATIRHLKNLGKTAFVNLQIITFMPTVLGVSFPSPFSDLLAILDFFKLDIGYVASGTGDDCYQKAVVDFTSSIRSPCACLSLFQSVTRQGRLLFMPTLCL